MRSIYKYVMFFLLPYVFISCEQENTLDESWEETWTIGSETIVTNEGITKFWIKRNENPVWEMTSCHIDGFTYESGYEYKIIVKAVNIPNPPMDGPSRKYSLVSLLSKEKKDSDVPELTLDISKCTSRDAGHSSSFLEESSYIGNGILKYDSAYVYQGDMMITEEQATNLVETRSGCLSNQLKYWPNNTVYYTFGANFTRRTQVEQAIAEWESKTSLTFVNSTGGGSYIEFLHDDTRPNVNLSYVGVVGGNQPIYLTRTCSAGAVMHEIGHAVGLVHEHSRNDRDSYVTIHYNNIEDEYKYAFDKYSPGTITDIGTFDFGSIMLYSSTDFSKNGNVTLTTKDGLCVPYQRSHLSGGDVQGIAAMYGPPFHKLIADINVITDEINGLYETYETEVTYTIKIYEDKACTIPASLTYPRSVTIYKHHVYYNPNTNRMHDNVTTTNVNLSAGTSTYLVDRVRNIEEYTMSNPDVYDVTTYSVSPYNNISQVY